MIIINGPSKTKIYRVECGKCGTVFECLEKEFKRFKEYSRYQSTSTDLLKVNCPFCDLDLPHPQDHYKFEKDSYWKLNDGKGLPYGSKIYEISYDESYIKNKFIDDSLKNCKTDASESL